MIIEKDQGDNGWKKRILRPLIMKKFVNLAAAIIMPVFCYSQEHFCAMQKQKSMPAFIQAQAKLAASPASHEMKYDMKFVHLSLNVERNTKYISGNCRTIATVTTAAMDTFMTILHLNLTIDSIWFNGAKLPFIRKDSMVKVKLPVPLNAGSSFTSIVFYKGTPPTGGSAIGSGFSNGTSGAWGNQATWSLSESFVAYHWWPCKQSLTDKIDSSWVFITTESTNKAGSNGLLTNVVTLGNKKRFEWKSSYPIDYYLISVAVARYKEYNLYAKPQYLGGDSILIQNYIYDNAINNNSWINSQKTELDKMPQVMNFLCNMYGMYPFYKEKYGHCMAPFSGGMEHQTMTSLGFFFYYINAHELGHQWWGDNVTCKSWGDIWINEGFASYTEHLVAQYLDPSNFAVNLNDVHDNVMSQPGGSVFFTGNDTMNTPRIFSSRLTYDKGGAIIHTLRFLTSNDSLWFQTLRGFQNLYKDGTASALDFKSYYETQTSVNATQFFNQWYYGQGYPTFNVKYNFNGSLFFLRSSQTVSMPSSVPLFITPMEYKIVRSGKSDTVIRVMHDQAVKDYTIALSGNVMGVVCDPNNWVINKVIGPGRDQSLGTASVSLTELDNESLFTLSPNPNVGHAVLNYSGEIQGKVHIYDMNGRLLSVSRLERHNKLDLTKFPAGVYILKIADYKGEEMFSERLVKE